jgi:hypothetical protein
MQPTTPTRDWPSFTDHAPIEIAALQKALKRLDAARLTVNELRLIMQTNLALSHDRFYQDDEEIEMMLDAVQALADSLPSERARSEFIRRLGELDAASEAPR